MLDLAEGNDVLFVIESRPHEQPFNTQSGLSCGNRLGQLFCMVLFVLIIMAGRGLIQCVVPVWNKGL